MYLLSGSGDNSGRSVTSVRLGQEFDVDVDAIAATMQGHSKGITYFTVNLNIFLCEIYVQNELSFMDMVILSNQAIVAIFFIKIKQDFLFSHKHTKPNICTLQFSFTS